MQDFEKLCSLRVEEIAEKTHIRINIVKAIVAKDFGAINAVKARGFISIIEKEFGFDLSEWLVEYSAFCNDKESTNEIFETLSLSPRQEKESNNKLFLSIVLVIAVVFILWNIFQSRSTTAPTVGAEQNIALASTPSVLNATDNATNATEMGNLSLPEVPNASAPLIKPEISNVTMPTITKGGTFTLTPTRPIWFKTTYLDNNSTENHEINTPWSFQNRTQVFHIDRGVYSLEGSFGKMPINATRGQKYLYHNGKLTKLSMEDYEAVKAGKLSINDVKGQP